MTPNRTTHQTRKRCTNIAKQNARIQTGSVCRSQAHWTADIRTLYHHTGRLIVTPSYRNNETYTAQRIGNETSSQLKPCFQIAHQQRGDLLVAVNEDGTAFVCQQTRKKVNAIAHGKENTHWRAHENAIFDVIWTDDDRHVVTASGDLSVAGWDVETHQRLFCFRDHHMSVKCVRQLPESMFLFASCSRDGTIAINDTRCASRVSWSDSTHVRPRLVSHPANDLLSYRRSKSRRRDRVGKQARSHSLPRRSVTCLEFRHCGGPSYQLITAGATDSVVRFWDLRTFMSMKARQPVSMVCCSSQVDEATKRLTGMKTVIPQSNNRGITSLSMDSTRSKLLVSILHGHLHLFDCRVPDRLHWMQSYRGHTTSSFYAKAAISQYGEFVACGSADGAVYVWDASAHAKREIESVSLPHLALKGHENEVNSVKFTPNGFDQLYSCGDDGMVRHWSLDRNGSTGGGFTLQANRQDQSGVPLWSNWDCFLSQSEGFAYRVVGLDPPENRLVGYTEDGSVTDSMKHMRRCDSLSPGIPKRFKKIKLSSGHTDSQSKKQMAPQRSLLYYWK